MSKKKNRDDNYVPAQGDGAPYIFDGTDEQLYDALGAVDALRLQFLEGAAQRLGLSATRGEAIEFFKDPGPEPPPDQAPPSRRNPQ